MVVLDNNKKIDNLSETGNQYEGLDESYLSTTTAKELKEIKTEYKELSRRLTTIRNEEFVLDNESRSLHR